MYEIQVITAAGLPAGFVWINNQRADKSGHVTKDAQRSDTKPAGGGGKNPTKLIIKGKKSNSFSKLKSAKSCLNLTSFQSRGLDHLHQ